MFMDFRKVWEAWEIKELAKKIGLKKLPAKADWLSKGLVDGNNSGSAAFDWAAEPGSSVEQIMSRISMPLADVLALEVRRFDVARTILRVGGAVTAAFVVYVGLFWPDN